MIFLSYFLLFVGGYISGFLIRRIFTGLGWGKTSCNIQKKGIRGRLIGSIFVVLIALYFQIPYLLILAGFMAYESRARWCVVHNFQ